MSHWDISGDVYSTSIMPMDVTDLAPMEWHYIFPLEVDVVLCKRRMLCILPDICSWVLH